VRLGLPRARGEPKARCAIVGLGRIGSTLEQDRLREKPATHAGAVAASRDCELEAGCDLRADRREAFARRWGCRSLYEDARLMLERHEPDILHVATPPESHLELVGLAAGAGVPVVICEKPLARSAGEARAIVDLCRQAGTSLLVNHERRYSEDYRRARARIAAGRFGEPATVAGRLHMGRGKAAADILWEDGTHLLDALRFLTGGELEALCACGDAGSPGGVLQVLLRAGGVPVALEVSGRLEPLVFELDLCFTRGRLRIGNGQYEEWESGPSPYYEGFRSLRRLRAHPPRRTGYFRGLLADAVEVLRQPGRRPVSSGEDGLAAAEAIEKILSLL
jgi:predicted dehydrogenase